MVHGPGHLHQVDTVLGQQLQLALVGGQEGDGVNNLQIHEAAVAGVDEAPALELAGLQPSG